MSPEEKRKQIADIIDKHGFSVNSVVLESRYTNLHLYLAGKADISSQNLYNVEQALDRLKLKLEVK